MWGQGFDGLVPVEVDCPLELDWLLPLELEDVEVLLVSANARPTEETAATTEIASIE